MSTLDEFPTNHRRGDFVRPHGRATIHLTGRDLRRALLFVALTGVAWWGQAKLRYHFLWRRVPAVVVATDVEFQHDRSCMRSRRECMEGWRTDLTYRYQVAGRPYVGAHLTPVTQLRSNRKAWKLAEQYPPGTRVLAFYDPDDPQRSFIRPESGAIVVLGWAATCLLALFVSLPIAQRRADERARAERRALAQRQREVAALAAETEAGA
jgi:hypothetical protein